jgi:hypothetical protein
VSLHFVELAHFSCIVPWIRWWLLDLFLHIEAMLDEVSMILLQLVQDTVPQLLPVLFP